MLWSTKVILRKKVWFMPILGSTYFRQSGAISDLLLLLLI
jgi:hypothetical protein